jgi:hypothetical protein
MKTLWLCSFAVLGAATAFAQSPASQTNPPASNDAQTILMTGCVARGSKNDPVTLTYAMVLPTGSPALASDAPPAVESATRAPEPASVSAPETQPRAIGTTGSISGTAPAGSSASSVDGYRLSGVDMTSWIGRRVQLTGTVVSPAPSPSPAATDSTGSAPAASLREFHVTNVQPVTGPCIK